MLREILQDRYYSIEFDRIILDKTFNGNMIQQIEYLLDRIKSLYKLRDDITEFLLRVNEREVCVY